VSPGKYELGFYIPEDDIHHDPFLSSSVYRLSERTDLSEVNDRPEPQL
jgi:hypothetical protein